MRIHIIRGRKSLLLAYVLLSVCANVGMKVERPAPAISRLQEMGEGGVLIASGDVFEIRDPNGYPFTPFHRERRPDAIRDHSGICENGIVSEHPV